MANRDTWRDAPLAGDNLYGDRDNVRRYRDAARDEHRRFAKDYELSQQGGEAFRHTLTEYDTFDADLTGGDYHPSRRHATEGGYAYGNYGGVTPQGRRYEGANPYLHNEMPRPKHGPKNFQRLDHRIYEDVCERLTDDDRIDASEIQVSVANGEVTLTGRVRSRQAKRRATDVVDNVFGVKDVHNSIRIQDDQTSPIGNWRET
jgi:hypothetical protein